MKLAFLIVIFALFGYTASAQEKIEVSDTVTVKINDSVFIVDVEEKNQLLNLLKKGNLPSKANFEIQSSSRTCNLLFQVFAIRKTNNEAIVTLHIARISEKNSSSSDEKIKIKRGEKKDLKLKPKLKCISYNYFPVSIIY
jgi:hypothetical protein